jgi:hypothetical protein
MAMKSPHSDWKLDAISPIDVRAVGLDQLLTNLWLCVLHGARPLVRMSTVFDSVAQVADLMERRHEGNFGGFDAEPGTAESWLRSDLLRVMKRHPEQFAVARPVHALATRLRGSARASSDSFASWLVHDWIQAVDEPLIEELRAFIDIDPSDEDLDLASYALALLGAAQEPDVARPGREQSIRPPLCRGQAATYCADLRRLLAYRHLMPRTVLVDHIQRLTGFHLGTYLLRLFQIVTDIEQRGGADRACDSCAAGCSPGERCPHLLELLVDCGEDARSPIAKLAEASWAQQEDRLGRYIRSHLTLKKLHEFATDLGDRYPDEQVPCDSVEAIAAVEHQVRRERLDIYFDSRLDDLRRSSGESGERIRELENEYRALGLSSFRTYVAVLAYFSERRWLNYHRYLLDSLFNKNSADGALRQPLGGRRRRRIALGASLLETLTLIAVVERQGSGHTTRPMRVDRLISHLENRYDLLISRPPQRHADDPQVLAALAANVDRFKARLRETGLFTDLSDAFLAQTVKPRFRLTNGASE